MKDGFRSDCPVASALDVVGDKWTLVIIKMMLLEGRKTFKDFLAGDEHIATNILSNRLKMLEEFHLIEKHKLPENKKTNIYTLTDKGLDLTPIVIEMALWSDEHIREFNPEIVISDQLTHQSKGLFIESIIKSYKASLS